MEAENIDFVFQRDSDDSNKTVFPSRNPEDAIHLLRVHGETQKWCYNNLTSTILNLIEKYEETNSRFQNISTLDLLAGIKFDSTGQDNGSLHGNRVTSEVTQKREHVNQSINDIDTNLGYNSTDIDTNLLNADTPHLHLRSGNNEITNALFENGRMHGSVWKDPTVRYNNPFDPRLTFDGLHRFQKPKSWNCKLEISKKCPETFNAFLDILNPSGFANKYLATYRQYLDDLRNISKRQTQCDTTNQKKEGYPVENLDTHNVPSFMDNECENIELWSRITATQKFWREDEYSRSPDDKSSQSLLCAVFSRSHEDGANEENHSSKSMAGMHPLETNHFASSTNSNSRQPASSTELFCCQATSKIVKHVPETLGTLSASVLPKCDQNNVLCGSSSESHTERETKTYHVQQTIKAEVNIQHDGHLENNRKAVISMVKDPLKPTSDQARISEQNDLQVGDAGDLCSKKEGITGVRLHPKNAYAEPKSIKMSTSSEGISQKQSQASMFWSHQQQSNNDIKQQQQQQQQQQKQQQQPQPRLQRQQQQPQLQRQQQQLQQQQSQQQQKQQQQQPQPQLQKQQQQQHQQQPQQPQPQEKQQDQQQQQPQPQKQQQQLQQQQSQQQKQQQQQPQLQKQQQQQQLKQQQSQQQQKQQQLQQPQQQQQQQQKQQQQQLQLQKQQQLQQQQSQQQQKQQQQPQQQQQKQQQQESPQQKQKQQQQQSQKQQQQQVQQQNKQQQQQLQQPQQQQQQQKQNQQQQHLECRQHLLQQKQNQEQLKNLQVQEQPQMLLQESQKFRNREQQQQQQSQEKQTQQADHKQQQRIYQQPQQQQKRFQQQHAQHQQKQHFHQQDSMMYNQVYSGKYNQPHNHQWSGPHPEYEQSYGQDQSRVYEFDQQNLQYDHAQDFTNGQQTTQYIAQNNSQPMYPIHVYYPNLQPLYVQPTFVSNSHSTFDPNITEQSTYQPTSTWQTQPGINYSGQQSGYTTAYGNGYQPSVNDAVQYMDLNFVQQARSQQPELKLDDEVWYINGLPHRHAKTTQQNVDVQACYAHNIAFVPQNFNWNAEPNHPNHAPSIKTHTSGQVTRMDQGRSAVSQTGTKKGQQHLNTLEMQIEPRNLNNNNVIHHGSDETVDRSDVSEIPSVPNSDKISSASLCSIASSISEISGESYFGNTCIPDYTSETWCEDSDIEAVNNTNLFDEAFNAFETDVTSSEIKNYDARDYLEIDNCVLDYEELNKVGRRIRVLNGRKHANRDRTKPQRQNSRNLRRANLINII